RPVAYRDLQRRAPAAPASALARPRPSWCRLSYRAWSRAERRSPRETVETYVTGYHGTVDLEPGVAGDRTGGGAEEPEVDGGVHVASGQHHLSCERLSYAPRSRQEPRRRLDCASDRSRVRHGRTGGCAADVMRHRACHPSVAGT